MYVCMYSVEGNCPRFRGILYKCQHRYSNDYITITSPIKQTKRYQQTERNKCIACFIIKVEAI